MTFRWKWACAAYVIVMAGASLVFVTGFSIFSGSFPGLSSMAAGWIAIFVVGVLISLLPFLLIRALMGDIKDLSTAAVGGVVLGTIVAIFLSVIDRPDLLKIFGFGTLGGVAGVAQLWLERAFDRRWPK